MYSFKCNRIECNDLRITNRDNHPKILMSAPPTGARLDIFQARSERVVSLQSSRDGGRVEVRGLGSVPILVLGHDHTVPVSGLFAINNNHQVVSMRQLPHGIAFPDLTPLETNSPESETETVTSDGDD